jgi:hypothetical protein
MRPSRRRSGPRCRRVLKDQSLAVAAGESCSSRRMIRRSWADAMARQQVPIVGLPSGSQRRHCCAHEAANCRARKPERWFVERCCGTWVARLVHVSLTPGSRGVRMHITTVARAKAHRRWVVPWTTRGSPPPQRTSHSRERSPECWSAWIRALGVYEAAAAPVRRWGKRDAGHRLECRDAWNVMKEGLPQQTEVVCSLNPRREALRWSISGSIGAIAGRRGAR